MGLLHRPQAGLKRRIAQGVALSLSLLLLGACSAETNAQWRNLAMPDPGTKESQGIFDLWIWAWVAAMATGVLVWGLIGWVVVRYRRRSEDEIPVQTRYNLPLEIFYTIVPILMVVVFFFWTVNVQNDVLSEEKQPDHTLVVVGQQWSWTFNYPGEGVVEANNVYSSGTGDQIPTLYLPVGETTRFELRSPDVIHSFWIPGFLMKMDIIPGRANHFQVTPREEGEYLGKCAELCGTYHSRMLFNVKVVSRAEYDAHLRDLEAEGNTSDAPIIGGKYADTMVGMETNTTDEGGAE